MSRGTLTRSLAQKQFARADEIARTMFGAYETAIPAYAQMTDPALREDVQSVSAALVRAWLHVMSTGRPVGGDELAPLREGARRRAAQGIDLQSMLRAYRLGIRVMWTELVQSPEWRDGTAGSVMDITESALDFADRVNTEVTTAYIEELEKVSRAREHRRSALLNVILAGPSSESLETPAELEHGHAVLVARAIEDLDITELENIGDALTRLVGATLWTVRHRTVIAAVPLDAGRGREDLIHTLEAPADQLRGLVCGVGGDARGAAEARQSYAEALEAMRVGEALDPTATLHDYQSLAPVIGLFSRHDQARRFVLTALHPLGDLTDKAWVLPTLEAYLERQGHIKEAAADLGLHLNTVKYRVRELKERLPAGSCQGERAAALLLAVKVRRVLDALG